MNEWDVIIDLIGEKSLSSLGKKSLHLSKILPLQEVLTEFEMIKEVGTLSGINSGLFSFRLDTLASVLDRFEENEPLEARDYRVIGDFLGSVRRTGEEIKKEGWAVNINSLINFDFNISFEMIIKQ